MKNPPARPQPTLPAWASRGLVAALLVFGGPGRAPAAGDPAAAFEAVAGAVAQARAAMSPEGREAHEAEINSALAEIRTVADQMAGATGANQAAESRIGRANASVESAQRDLSNYLNQVEGERQTLVREAQTWIARQDEWNRNYANKAFDIPEPFNSIQAERQRISDAIDSVNARGEVLADRIRTRQRQLEAVVTTRFQEVQNAVQARDRLKQGQLEQVRRFEQLITGLNDRLIAWVKENPTPAPGGFNVKDNVALRDLMRAFNQGDAAGSHASDQFQTRYAPAKSASNVVFDIGGGSDDGLAVIVGSDRVPAPPDMRKNEAVNALVRNLGEAQNAVSEAQKQWDAVIRDRTATPQQLRSADVALTTVTNRLQQLRYEQKQATDLFGRSAPQ